MQQESITELERYQKRWGALKQERSSWVPMWQDISENLLPRSGRFVSSDRNRGGDSYNAILDPTATKALHTLGAGLMAGMTSPARPWFRLATNDPDMMEFAPVKQWLHDVTVKMRDIFSKSNTYRALHMQYEELGAFSTSANLIMPNYENVIHNHTLTIGEYAISADSDGYVDSLYREFDMTVSQIVTEFGLGNVSNSVKNLYEKHNMDTWVTVVHAIEKNTGRDSQRKDAKNKPWRSVYFELGQERANDNMLRESGFDDFPIISARWAVAGGDIYGHGPGMESLGLIQQLQSQQLMKARGIDYQTNPPLQVPITMKERESDFLPGGVTYVDSTAPQAGVRNAMEVRFDLQYLSMDIQDIRQLIREVFYADLFAMISQDTRSNITAREIAERHEEKLLLLGPVLERLHNEMLNPLIDITFAQMVRTGILPPPPKELQGEALNVEFVSMLAQAQRAVGVGAIDRLLGTVGGIAQMKPEVLDKIDGDQIIDAYSDMLGVDPELIVADDKVTIIREQRAQQEQAMQQQAMMAQSVDMAQKASQASTEEGNLLSDVTRQFTGL